MKNIVSGNVLFILCVIYVVLKTISKNILDSTQNTWVHFLSFMESGYKNDYKKINNTISKQHVPW